KIESGHTGLHLDNVHLHQLLTDIVGMFTLRAAEKGLTLDRELSDDLPAIIYIDAGKLRQILVNLLSNAIKSTSSGTVTLRAVVSSAPFPISVPPEPADVVLSFEVEDTGSGIRPEEMPKIFEAFVQSEVGLNTRSGTGLGLSITQAFVALMGGELQVTSGGVTYRPGAPHPWPVAAPIQPGSCFQVILPVALGEASASLPAAPARQIIGLAEGTSPRILIAEDKWESSHLLEQLLRPLGFALRVAENGQAAVDLWRTWRPHLIWMDMRMPVMNGFEATQYIKSQPGGQQTVIIALTASSLERDRSNVMAAGCDDYVRKPFRTEVILEKIGEHLGVRYRYAAASATKATGEAVPEAPAAVVLAHLPHMPTSWVTALRQAAKCADNELIMTLLEDAAVTNPHLSQAVRSIVDDFRYDILIQAAEQVSWEQEG
ncbi:MAG: response regulator, partial [Cyanobacteria bacterium P01_A01_bin.135]